MRAAFFDIGTNSIHLLVVEIRKDLSFEVLDHEKDDTRLGDGSFETRRLKKETMRRAISVIDRFCRIAKKYGVTRTAAKATSAVRDAKNGREFAAAVARKTGVKVEIITGEEESRLIFLGARANVETNGRRVLVIDVGGGSVELIVGDSMPRPAAAQDHKFLKSYPLGVARLTDLFLKSDPPEPKELRRTVRHAVRTIGKDAKKIRKFGFSMAIGTSGTLINLGSMIYEAKTKRPLYPVNQFEFSEKSLRKIHERLICMNLKERLKLPGLDAKRADLIVAGSTLTAALMKLLKIKTITLSSGGIRDGMVLDFIAKNRKSFGPGEESYSIREKSVRTLARRCSPDPKHDEQVARLALAIFDGTRTLHGLGDPERELLLYSALLHDVGRHVSFKKYQKHTHYLITHSDLDGFAPEEIETLSWVAREAVPKKKERRFVGRSGTDKIGKLTAILRIADALDRSRFSVIKSLECRVGPSAVSLRLKTVKEAELEIWQAQAKSELFEEVLGRKLVITGGRP